MNRASRAVERFFAGFAFPLLCLLVLASFALGTLALLLVPASDSGLGAFAEQFRVWCFGVPAAPGLTRSAAVAAVFVELFGLMLIIAWVWRRPLQRAWRRRDRRAVPVAGAAAVVFALCALGLFALVDPAKLPADPTVFQPRALRIAVPAPALSLVDHEGQPVELKAFEGRVVVLTAVYATCGLACPRILGQAKRVVARLTDAERAELVVLGVTLDPAHDTVEQLHRMAEAQGVRAPLYRLLTGGEAEVDAVLDRMEVQRRRDPKTGLIDHSNLFLLVDRQGRLAYRFTVDDLQERWMTEALRLLLAEHVKPQTASRD